MRDNLDPPDGAGLPPMPPKVPYVQVGVQTEEQDIEFVQAKRREIVHLTLKDGDLPDDKAHLAALMQSLDGLDRSATARMRIKSESESAKGQSAATAAVAHMLQQMTGGASKPADANREPPSLPASIAPPINPHELVTGTHPVRISEIIELPLKLPAAQEAK